MDELTGNVIDLTKASIELSEAAANYGALKVIFGVFLVVVLLMCVMFFYQIWHTQKRLSTIEEASDKTLKFFSDLNNRTIGKEEAKSIVREALKTSESLVKYYILKIRLEHHVQDKQFTEEKIRSLVDNDFSSRQAFLGRFVVANKQLATAAAESEESTNIAKLMKDWVYKTDDDFAVSLMAQAVDIYFDGLKIQAQSKIDNF